MTTGARFYTALDHCMQRSDQLETECLKDIESARMFRSAVRVAFHAIIKCFIPCRLLTKLGTVVDRTELNMETTWAETGDRSVQILMDLCYGYTSMFRYMLKLFRDYVFHQVMEDGRPFLDMAHVIACLNRLDAGIPDKVTAILETCQNIF